MKLTSPIQEINGKETKITEQQKGNISHTPDNPTGFVYGWPVFLVFLTGVFGGLIFK